MLYTFIHNNKHIQKESRTPPTLGWWLRFDAETHTYTDSYGYDYTSVTRWISEIDDRPFNAERMSIECAQQRDGKYAGMFPDEIQAQWENTAEVGSELHAAIEAQINGLFDESPKHKMSPIVTQFETWRRMTLPDHVRPERIFWSRKYRLAGTFDIVSSLPDEGIRLDDIKTYLSLTPGRKKKAALQLTLGALMVEELFGTPALVGGIVLYENYYHLRSKARLTFEPCKDLRTTIQPYLWAREYKVRQEEEHAMALQITGGKLPRPKRVCIHGVPGVGKSTFASRFPGAVFIDTEGSTAAMDVKRLETPKSWNGLLQLLADIKGEKTVPFKSLVLDTVDWAERMAMEIVAKHKNKQNFADISYGAGDKALAELFKKVLDNLADLQVQHDLTICLIAHTWIKHFDPPDMPEGYDRYEMKLTKHVAPLVTEWSDMVLFANFVSNVKKSDNDKAKGVGKGEQRLLYTEKTDAYEAKNRDGLDGVLPFAYKHVAHIIEGTAKKESE